MQAEERSRIPWMPREIVAEHPLGVPGLAAQQQSSAQRLADRASGLAVAIA